MLVLLWLPAIQVEKKWRKNLFTGEPLSQICILQLEWCFNSEMKIRKIACPIVDGLLGILEMTGTTDFSTHSRPSFTKHQAL